MKLTSFNSLLQMIFVRGYTLAFHCASACYYQIAVNWIEQTADYDGVGAFIHVVPRSSSRYARKTLVHVVHS